MTMIYDFRIAIRRLRQTPGFAFIAIVTLALGVGANSAIFSFIDGFILKPLPYRHADRLVVLMERSPSGDLSSVSAPTYLDWKTRTAGFEYMAALMVNPFYLATAGEPREVRGARVTADYFKLFGAGTILGRTFTAEDNNPGQDHVVVLSNSLWQTQFGATPDIIGQTIRLNGQPFTVVGVLSPDYRFDFAQSQLWVALSFDPDRLAREQRSLIVIGRMRESGKLSQAQSELALLSAQIAGNFPDTNKGWGSSVELLADLLSRQTRGPLYVLQGIVTAVLLIGCVNLANLLLARGTSREREMAICSALGATRNRLIRQFLIESSLLVGCGSLLGLVLGYGLVMLVKSALPPGFLATRLEIGLDPLVLLFTLGISLLAGLVFGVVPAIQVTKVDLVGTLKEGSHGSTGGMKSRTIRSALVICEVAISIILLIVSGLLLRSFFRMQQADWGFTSDRVLTMKVHLSEDRYRDRQQLIGYLDRVLEEVRSIPDLRESAITSALPLEGWGQSVPFSVASRPPPDITHRQNCFFKVVSPLYFRVVGMRLLRGRGLAESDRQEAPLVAVINETMAKRHFQNQDPLGQRLSIPDAAFGREQSHRELSWEIVGVVNDEKVNELTDINSQGIYVSYTQSPSLNVFMLTRAADKPSQIQNSVISAIHQVDKDQVLIELRTLDQVKSQSMAPHQIQTLLIGSFALLALTLTALGIYGMVSYSVAQRTREIGIRAALGAEPKYLVLLVIKGGMRSVIAGMSAGIIGSLLVTRLLASLLFGVNIYDLLTMSTSSLVLIGIALLACYLPARRAYAVNPTSALRAD